MTRIRHELQEAFTINSWNDNPHAKRMPKSATSPTHGINCPKVPHTRHGYLHEASDDGAYDVDGISYCGRCHEAIPS